MALGKKTGGRKEGTPNKQRRPKRATEEREAAKNALVNTARGLLDHPQIITVMRRLGKERMTEVEEMALEEALACRDAARAGDVQARDQFYRYLGLALEAAERKARPTSARPSWQKRPAMRLSTPGARRCPRLWCSASLARNGSSRSTR